MPIEIRELTIKATVGHAAPSPNRAGSGTGANVPSVEKKAIIEECVERVLDILQKQKER